MKPFLILLLLLLLPCSSSSLDIISLNNPLRDGDQLVSGGQTFALGFFSPKNSVRRYVGIWFHTVSEQTVVWVANRDAPLNDTSGRLALDSYGNFNLYAHNGNSSIWTAGISTPMNNSVVHVSK
ncbi:G-type lectin S-receptor-like serine/threonine-protein kinase RKS1 [Linum grandiflorum]